MRVVGKILQLPTTPARMTNNRKKMMKEIEANKVKLVVVVGKLLEGFDHPPISIAAILTKTGSPVKFIGRAQNLSHSYKRRKHC